MSANGQSHKIKIEPIVTSIASTIKILSKWVDNLSLPAPDVMINKHCQMCQFEKQCSIQAEEKEDLSLLERITPKEILKYHKKGIFTIQQLSYAFKSRRTRKQNKKIPVSFKVELQTLAIKTKKIYVQALPTLTRSKIELFLDFEGVPDQKFHYLIGLSVNEEGNRSHYSFWADNFDDELRIWTEFLEKISEYPDSPIYHYGNYEFYAISNFEKKYDISCEDIKNRLINLNTSIYGKIYFPTRSNGLKDLGRFLGATWSNIDSSGLQSLVWRHFWHETSESKYKKLLLTYNREDCEALILFLNELLKIATDAADRTDIDFVDQPKQNATPIGHEIHGVLESAIRYTHANYNKKRVVIREKKTRMPLKICQKR